MKYLYKLLDCLGVMTLQNKEISGIEKYVSLEDHIILSRNKKYYEPTTLEELSKNRDYLYSLISNNRIKNYVLLDYIIQFSAQATYYCLTNKDEKFQHSLTCLEDDVKNIVNIIENKQVLPVQSLPISKAIINTRYIEADNKLLLYSFTKSFKKIPQNCLILTLGLGSILIGPFFKAIKNADYKIINFSRYKKIQDLSEINEIKNQYSKFYIIDDSVGSGLTTKDFSKLLFPASVNISAIEFDWLIYDMISEGKSTYFKFDINSFTPLTLFNVRNHKFLDDAISKIEKPSQYFEILKKNSFKNEKISDIEILSKLGENLSVKYLPATKFKETKKFTQKILKFYKEQ